MSQVEYVTQPRKPKRGRETAWDMLRSMGVLAAFVAAIALVTYRPHVQSNALRAVDAVAVAAGSQQVAGFGLVVPTWPNGWTVTSARLEPVPNDISHHMWHIGVVTADNGYVQLEQSDTALRDRFLATYLSPTGMDDMMTAVGSVSWLSHPTKDQTTVGFSTTTADSLIIVVAPESADSAAALDAVSAAISAG